MTKCDQFISQEMPKFLRQGEQVTHAAVVVKAPPLWLQILLLGGLLQLLLTKAYFAMVTNSGRLVLMRTSLGMFGVSCKNKGFEEIPLYDCREVKIGGLLNNRSMTFVRQNGSSETIRIAPWSKQVSGQKQFFEQVPMLVNQRQLAASA